MSALLTYWQVGSECLAQMCEGAGVRPSGSDTVGATLCVRLLNQDGVRATVSDPESLTPTGASKSMAGPTGTMPVGLMVVWLI
jgi:hypothetical protein